VLYIDQSRIQPGMRNLVLRDAREFLAANLWPGDRTLVATFDGASLKILSMLSTDPGQAIAALEAMERETGVPSSLRAMASRIQSEILGADPRSNSSAFDFERLLGDIEGLMEAETLRSRNALNGVRDLLAIVAGVEGRVGMIFAGGGFDASPVENLYTLLERRFGQVISPGRSGGNRQLDGRSSEIRTEYGRLLADVNSSRITIYTVHAGDGRGPDVTTADIGGSPDASGPSLAVGTGPEGGSSLAAFAAETGGRTFLAATDLSERLTVARNDFATYYSLGYRPDRPASGTVRELSVRVKREGVKVIHRRGVQDRTPQQEGGNAALAALLSDTAPANELGIGIEVGAPEKPKRGKSPRVPILVKVPVRAITLVPDAAGHRAHLEFYFSIRDPDGGFRRLEPRELAFAIPGEKLAAASGQAVAYKIEIALEPGSYRVGVAALDRIGGTRGSAVAPIQVAKAR
jgi:VWFA-related protein